MDIEAAAFKQFFDEYFVPDMVGAGYRRAGRSLVREWPDESRTIIYFQKLGGTPEVRFRVIWGVVPRVLRDFRAQPSAALSTQVFWGVYVTSLSVPPSWKLYDYPTSAWWFLPAQLPDFGARFRRHVREHAIPRWDRAWHRDYLINALQIDEDRVHAGIWSMGPPALVEAVLSIQVAEPDHLDHLLDKCPQLSSQRIELIRYLREIVQRRRSAT
jgi:hypothetical protein